jgi:hypothetical protein
VQYLGTVRGRRATTPYAEWRLSTSMAQYERPFSTARISATNGFFVPTRIYFHHSSLQFIICKAEDICGNCLGVAHLVATIIGTKRDFGAILGTQLLHDVAHMYLHSALAQTQFVRDDLIRLSLSQNV